MTRARDLGDFIADGGAPELVVDTTTLVVDSTNNRVGIGTASPSQPLTTLAGTANTAIARFSGSEGARGLVIETASTTRDDDTVILNANDAFGTIAIETNSTERMRIDSSGVVNVGTASGTQPSYFNSFLNVQNNGSTGSHASVTITSGSGGFAGLHFGDSDNGRIGQVTYNNSDNSLLLTANNSERFRIASAGQLGIAGANYGTSGQVLTSGGSGAAPSWADAGGGGTVQFTASGSLSNGNLVKLNSNGTVSVVAGGGPGSATVFETSTTSKTAATFDSNSNKVVIAYADAGNSSYGTAVVGTVSGTSISFGTPVVYRSDSTTYTACVFDSNSNKVVIAYRDIANSNYGTAIVGTVSGTSISFGSAVVFETAEANYITCAFDSNANKVVIAYKDDANNGYATAIVGTVSGTSISFGSHTVFSTFSTEEFSATFDSNSNKVVIAYKGDNSHGHAIVGTVSGTSISFGSAVIFKASNTNKISATFDSNSNKVVIASRNQANSYYGEAIVGNVSGTSISFGDSVTFEYASSDAISATFDSNSNKIVIAYADGGNTSFGTVVTGIVRGTSISFSSPTVFESADISQASITFDSNSNKSVIAYRDSGNSNYGTALVYTTPDITEWIGFASADVSDGATATINVVSGVNEGQSGLTTGFKYHITDSGTLTENFLENREVGVATAATKLLITKGSVS